MHRPILLALPLACLALLSSIAFLAVVFIAAGLHMVWTIKELEDPRTRNLPVDRMIYPPSPRWAYCKELTSRDTERLA